MGGIERRALLTTPQQSILLASRQFGVNYSCFLQIGHGSTPTLLSMATKDSQWRSPIQASPTPRPSALSKPLQQEEREKEKEEREEKEKAPSSKLLALSRALQEEEIEEKEEREQQKEEDQKQEEVSAGLLQLPSVRRFSLARPDPLQGGGREGDGEEGREEGETPKWAALRTFERQLDRLVVRAMRVGDFVDTESLLTDSFAELMWGPLTYRPLLSSVVSSYLRDRQAFLPDAVTLIALSPLHEAQPEEREDGGVGKREEGEGEKERDPDRWVVVGTVEISFNAKGQPGSPPTPLPPKDSAFLCNMAVQQKYRRQGIGWRLLKSAEDLARLMGCKEIYLHCRTIDTAPLTMYKKAGYSVVDIDSILSLLLLQPRRFLMKKSIVLQSVDRGT